MVFQRNLSPAVDFKKAIECQEHYTYLLPSLIINFKNWSMSETRSSGRTFCISCPLPPTEIVLVAHEFCMCCVTWGGTFLSTAPTSISVGILCRLVRTALVASCIFSIVEKNLS
mmetsp:Transcript_21360/g.31702  ORF Transcript_21360/g.31702 Transcript_21360/m.31702 type:complete len:114 (+) Transcript_21360:584-925(+)